MKKTILSSLLICGLMLGACTSKEQITPSYDKGINIIPLPMELVQSTGDFKLEKDVSVCALGDEAKTIAEFFATKIRRSTGFKFPVSLDKADAQIRLSIDPSLGLKSEGYKLNVTTEGIQVVGQTAQGLFYGMQSLMQLLPAEIESQKLVDSVLWQVPSLTIKDEPAFAYRGMLIDVCRHFLTVEEMKRQIDVLALFKINRLHWHLTEDQGWRIEIKKYPRLTEVGSKRIEGDGTEYGGFYTQEEIKELVAYASERFITIIPEIEMPGHSMSAIKAYPELACNPKTQSGKEYELRNIWGVEDDVYCAGNDKFFEFISDVIDEVAPLFPGEYFHIGGDECPKVRWKQCPRCQKRIKDEGLKDEHELQSYVIRRAQDILAKHGKKLIGWDEILEGGLAPSATVMSWRGEAGGIQSANMGHDVIMTPGDGGLYIDHYQGDSKIEPVAIFGYAPLEKTYSYYPVPKDIAEDKRHHILGAQANLWGEYLYSAKLYEYRAYPRVIALAELTWTTQKQKDFADFSRRLNNAYVRLDAFGINYHIPLPEQPNGSCNFVAFNDKDSLVLKTTRPMTMVYTLDGTEPTASSKVYTEPIQIDKNAKVKVATVLPSGKLSAIRTIIFEKQEFAPASELKAEELKEGLKLWFSKGKYGSAKELDAVKNWEEKQVNSFAEMKINGMGNNAQDIDYNASIAEGYFEVPEDGVYFFSTNNEELWIDGVKLIDNAGEVKKFSRHDSSKALKKGLHSIKAIFIGSIDGGFPSYWDDAKVWMRSAKEDKFYAMEKLWYK